MTPFLRFPIAGRTFLKFLDAYYETAFFPGSAQIYTPQSQQGAEYPSQQILVSITYYQGKEFRTELTKNFNMHL